jgi:hypothetical protein
VIERSTNPTPTLQSLFPHEQLRVYNQAISFVAWAELLNEKLPRPLAVATEFENALTAIPLTLAVGNVKASAAERLEHLEAARTAALRCAACLDVLVAKKRLLAGQVFAGKKLLAELVATLVSLIQSAAQETAVITSEPPPDAASPQS